MSSLSFLIRAGRTLQKELTLPKQARLARKADRRGLHHPDAGCDIAVSCALDWLAAAQDYSASQDGGVARHYSLITGWASSYPETTGYIIPTVLEASRRNQDQSLEQRAQRMIQWLLDIQMLRGAFYGGTVATSKKLPTVFNTGQILIGLSCGATHFGQASYYDAANKAAQWLCQVQDPTGCWKKHLSPVVSEKGPKTYATHAAWGLLEAAKATQENDYADAAIKNIRWALSLQQDNGWFPSCCLTDATNPLTHTLGYTLRGCLEGFAWSGDEDILGGCLRTADALLKVQNQDGSIPGRLDCQWKSSVNWVCLTGLVQISDCWLILYQHTGDTKYLAAAQKANAFARRTLQTEGEPQHRGAIQGSMPVDGWYGRFEYLNWACKFFIDANVREMSILQQDANADS